MCECVCVCMREKESVCVCVCVRERERERESMCVCVRGLENVCVCVCVCVRGCVCVDVCVCVCVCVWMCVCVSQTLSSTPPPVSGAAWPSIWQLYTRPGVCVWMCVCVSNSLFYSPPVSGAAWLSIWQLYTRPGVCVCVCDVENEWHMCVCVRERDLENECVCARVSVCEKRERVWVYVCVMVWACVVPSSILCHSRWNCCCIAPSLKTWQLHACTWLLHYDTPQNFPPCSLLCSGCPFRSHQLPDDRSNTWNSELW